MFRSRHTIVLRVSLALLSIWVAGASLRAQEAEQSQPADKSPATTSSSSPSTSNAQTTSSAEPVIVANYGDTDRACEQRTTTVQQILDRVNADLADLEAQQQQNSAPELTEKKSKLLDAREQYQQELKFLKSIRSVCQGVGDLKNSLQQFRAEMEQFRNRQKQEPQRFVPSDVTVFQNKLNQLRTTATAQDERQASRIQRLTELREAIPKAVEPTLSTLKAEQRLLQMGQQVFPLRRALLEAEQALLEAKLAAAEDYLAKTGDSQPVTTTSAPASDEVELQAKAKLAEQLKAEATDRRGFAQAKLRDIEKQLAHPSPETDVPQLEGDREYWRRIEEYEARRIRQATLHEMVANEKRELSQIAERIQTARDELEQLRSSVSQMSPQQRRSRAEDYRQQAEKARQDGIAADKRSGMATTTYMKSLQEDFLTLDPILQAIKEHLAKATSYREYERLGRHLRRMSRQLDAERQQIDLMIMTVENVSFAVSRQATLNRDLADVYTQSADVLVPPVPPFWERHVKILNTIKIIIVAFAITYGVQFLIFVAQQVMSALSATAFWKRGGFSVRRANTLLGFASSLIKFFVWVIGLVMVLSEFGIDPAKSTGIIGLVGLILAGMFQQLVIDFVKGLDIVAGRHYNVGDFVELDGKLGHVVDFSVKHTRIRTFSGQEYNIPNSKCVPSRRFPDGYVNNYVDIPLVSVQDQYQAKNAIDAICRDLTQRLEALRDLPSLVRQFPGAQGQIALRYRLRVLPGCDWVITDYFLPRVKAALSKHGIELAGEPTFFFINHIETFRKLFSRQLSEEEIVREVAATHTPPQLPNS